MVIVMMCDCPFVYTGFQHAFTSTKTPQETQYTVPLGCFSINAKRHSLLFPVPHTTTITSCDGVMQSAKMELQTSAAAATLTAVAAKKKKSAQAAKAPVKPAASTPSDETEEDEDVAGEPEEEGGGLATLSEAADTAAGKLTIWMNVQQN